MKLLILSLLLGSAAASRTAPDVAERVAQEARENIQIHDGFLADEKKDITKEKQVKANKDLSALQKNTSEAKPVVAKAHTEAPKNATAAKVHSDKDIAEHLTHLEQVVTGLQGIASQQKAKGEQKEGKFSAILEPFLKSMTAVLSKVKTDTKLSNDQKFEMLENAQASVSGLAKDMAKRQHELSEESDAEKESLLIGILMARKNRPEAEQMDVMKSDQFKDLSVVKEVLAHRKNGTSLAEQVAENLDKKGGKKQGGNFLKKQAAVAGIVTKLQGQVDKMEKHLKLSEEEHKKHMAKVMEAMKKDEAKAKGSNGTKAEVEKKVQRIHAKEMHIQKKLERDYQKWSILAKSDAKSLHEAIDSIKKGDLTALAKARKALTDSLKRMQSNTGDFLHFLQLSTWRTESRDGACPYCKAQCLEKCHNGGSSFMQCMGQCADVGN